MTVLAQLLATYTDNGGYITYVFENLEEDVAKESKYIMCVRYPNWNHRPLKLGEVGFLFFIEVIAGKDTWFDGSKNIPYKYDAIRFEKFIEKPKKLDVEYVM
jgi:hypothetical protein